MSRPKSKAKPRARKARPKKHSRLKQSSALMAGSVALVGAWEGMKLAAYHDIVGVPTVCFGETRGVKMGDKYTKEQCQVMLGDGLIEFEAGMRACLKSPDKIPDGPYIAFLSLSYNIGISGFCRSSVSRNANKGELIAACNSILLWNRAGGKVVQGLVNRRKHEQKICLTGLTQPTMIALKEEPDRRWFTWLK